MDKKLIEEVAQSLRKNLLSHFGESPKFDTDAAVKIISDFIMKKEFESEPFSRYEAYNEILQKAEAVATGWLQNCSSEIKHYEDTKPSLESYISNTYGKTSV